MIAILAAIVLTAVAIGTNAWLLHADGAREMLTPDPPRVVQNFIGALSARRPAIAESHVALEVRAGLSEDRLRAFASGLRARYGAFRFADATEERDGNTARVRAKLKTDRAGEIEVPFRLTRDPSTHLWKIIGEI
jgi:hypothetical protein